MRRNQGLKAVQINSYTVQVRDIITIGGEHFRVVNIVKLHGGARRLHLHSGEILSIHDGTTLMALRPPEPPSHGRWQAPSQPRERW